MNKKFMQEALSEAHLAFSQGEVPVGAVIVKDGKIIARAHNAREQKKNALSHAEIECINKACNVLGDWRLDGCEMYVTLEPCPMCTGAILNARISTLVFGAYDLNAGSIESVANIRDHKYFKIPEIYGGILEDECKEILKESFLQMRNS